MQLESEDDGLYPFIVGISSLTVRLLLIFSSPLSLAFKKIISTPLHGLDQLLFIFHPVQTN